jgi:hypothetical protein
VRPQARRGPPGRTTKGPGIVARLHAAVEPATGGDPRSLDKYARRWLPALSDEPAALGHRVGPTTVGRLRRGLGYNRHVNGKRFTGPPHADRDRPFDHIAARLAEFRAAGLPMLSVDTKKKAQRGNGANPGRVWGMGGAQVNAHDFKSAALCRAVP